MARLTVLKGLPASGKSTFSKDLVRHGFCRLNKDNLRAMLHDHWSKDNEKATYGVERAAARVLLAQGRDVVIDDTNLTERHELEWRAIAKECNADFKLVFFDIPVETCIERDALREGSAHVGEDVIRKLDKTMWRYNDL